MTVMTCPHAHNVSTILYAPSPVVEAGRAGESTPFDNRFRRFRRRRCYRPYWKGPVDGLGSNAKSSRRTEIQRRARHGLCLNRANAAKLIPPSAPVAIRHPPVGRRSKHNQMQMIRLQMRKRKELALAEAHGSVWREMTLLRDTLTC